MSYPKKDPLEKKYGVCGCVTIDVKERIRKEAANRGVSIGVVIGEILAEWSKMQGELEGEKVYLPYRQDQSVKPSRDTKIVREGPLGKEKRESVILKVGRGN